ncbi:FAD-binding domain-containing protein [Hymenopellis radicata]|nr:FAD-binding domain-containing protein [Hymenopellis radicata]
MLPGLLLLFPLTLYGACADLASLNTTLAGRLASARPIAEPCFEDDQASCLPVQQGYLNPAFRVERYDATMYPSFETCLATGEGCVLNYANINDSSAWINRTCHQGSISSTFVEITTAADVQSAFEFARETGTLLSIKNTGHDFIGRSVLKDSLALWTHNLKSLEYNAAFVPEGGNTSYSAITAGAGVEWIEVYKFADEHNVTAIGGYHTTVGATGGWLMGGGHSILSPVYGLGVDRVLQFKIVTPDGVYRTVNEFNDIDLFWALRGGGGGTFGVVLEATMLVEPQLKLQVASLSINRTTEGARGFLQIAIDNGVKWGQEGWGGHIFGDNLLSVNPLLTLDEAKASMKEAADYTLSQNGTVIIEEVPSWYAFFQNYVPSVQAVVGIHIVLGTRLIPTSLFSNETAKAQLLDTFVDMLPFATADPQLVAVPPILYNHTEGATSVTPAWRDALWHVIFAITMPWNATAEQKQDWFNVVQNASQPLRDLTPDSGAYLNEAFIYEPDFETAFWGENYPRLLSIKEKYDPDGLLDCWHCVGWKGAEDERYGCYPEFS